MINGEAKPRNADIDKIYEKANRDCADRGERVLGFAQLKLDKNNFPRGFEFNTAKVNFPLDNLTFVGYVSLEDPPRLGVPLAVLKCQSAGIKVIMVTGDFPLTAASIAK